MGQIEFASCMHADLGELSGPLQASVCAQSGILPLIQCRDRSGSQIIRDCSMIEDEKEGEAEGWQDESEQLGGGCRE